MSIIYEKASACFKPHDTYATATGVHPDGTKVKLRLFKTGEDICYFKKGSHKRGYRVDEYNTFIDILPVKHYKSTQKKWESGWKKTKAKMEASGLWKELVKEIEIALDIGYDKMQDLYTKYWEIQDEDKKLEYVKQVDKRLIGMNSELEFYIKSSLIWNYARCPKVKKMYFGKYKTPEALDSIQKAMQNKTKLSEYGKASYDVSFEYNPEQNKAWYSEQFSGCGNGHYYLAISPTHALLRG